jgi:DNA-binding transcriptional LysR family regulator
MRALLEPSLYYFSVVARYGSLSAAAEKLGVSISALSRHITKLEGDVGVALFERHARGMSLSYAGKALYSHAQRSIADAESVTQDIRGEDAKRLRRLSIACTEGMAFDFLPVCISAFRQREPDCSIDMKVVSPEMTSQMLLSGDASIAMAFSVKPEPGVKVQFSMPAPVMALMRDTHPLAGRTSLGLADLTGYPVLLQDEGQTNRQLFDIACNVEGIKITPAVSSHYVAGLYRFVQTMEGAIMPSGYVAVAQRIAADRLVAVPFTNQVLGQRRLQVKTLAGRPLSGLAEQCLEWIVSQLQAVDEQLSERQSRQ